MTPLVELNNLHVTFNLPSGAVRAVRGVSLDIEQGEILGVVGESGCGKSVTFRALLGLAPSSASVSGKLRFSGEDMSFDGEAKEHVSLIYQNAGAALNPVFTIGQQLGWVTKGELDSDELTSLLDRVGLPDPERALRAYPHEYSGGMQQRAVIAYALASDPKLLIADEPTTALDVTTQAQVLDLLRGLRDTEDLTIVFISHDLAVIRQVSDRVAVLYAGQVVEIGGVDQVLNRPSHPYTQALLSSIPTEDKIGQQLMTIEGSVPDGRHTIEGCAYKDRCAHAREECGRVMPEHRNISDGHTAACVLLGVTGA